MIFGKLLPWGNPNGMQHWQTSAALGTRDRPIYRPADFIAR